MQKILLIGNLGQTPELKNNQNSTDVYTTFSVAVNDKVYNKDTNQYDKYTEWYSVTAFGKNAENITKYMFKGSKIYLEGKAKVNTWFDKVSGDMRAGFSVSLHNFTMLGESQPDNNQATNTGFSSGNTGAKPTGGFGGNSPYPKANVGFGSNQPQPKPTRTTIIEDDLPF